jgi:TfoX/Sxy family transcriptional regulator of competence genes
MSPDQEHLLAAVRDGLRRLTGTFDERRMFGGVTMMVNGNMLCCVARQGLMVRVGAEGEAAALARPAAQPCMGTGRRMAGFVMVDHDGLATPQDVAEWLRIAYAYVKALPPKPVGRPVRTRKAHS